MLHFSGEPIVTNIFQDHNYGQVEQQEPVVISKKKVWLPPEIFQCIGDIPDINSTSYKCLMHCTPKRNADGSEKYISVSNSSRYNATTHIKVKLNRIKMKKELNKGKVLTALYVLVSIVSECSRNRQGGYG